MNFTDALNNTTSNISYTENGMQGYKTIDNPYLDFLYKVSSFRSLGDLELNGECHAFINKVFQAHQEKYLLKFILYIRDPRNGLGERRLGRELLSALFFDDSCSNYKEIFTWVVNHLQDYGRWDDLVYLYNEFDLHRYDEEPWLIAQKLREVLENDIELMKNNAQITLLAKWMPSINTSSKETKETAKELCMDFKWSEKRYRKNLSELRKYLKVTERQMSHNEWKEIDYEKVPSLANLRYKDAFLRHDEERRKEYLNKLSKGEAKINSTVNFPHDVVHKYTSTRYWCGRYYTLKCDETLEQLWKNLKQIDGLKDTLVVRDDSVSMTNHVGNSKVTALEVATALGIYCAEHCRDSYKNKIITFSETPRYLDFSDKTTLCDKLIYLYRHSEVANTNIRAVFQLILKTAIDNKLKQEDLPKQILIISDMEFDQGASYIGNPIEESQVEYKKYGYTVPKLVFWNVCSRTETISVKENELGVYLLSGFSPNVLSMLDSGELDPFKALLKILDKSCFKKVPEIK